MLLPCRVYIDGTSSANYVGAVVANRCRAVVGCHAFEFDIPGIFRDNLPHVIRAYGLDLTNGPPTLLTNSPMSFTLPPRVETVVFEPITNETIIGELTNSEIDRPGYGHFGQRIFPDRKFPTDTVNHKRVKVKAVVGKPNVTVYFKNFDVDDPSDDPIIDGTGNNGNDNHAGRIVGGAYPSFARGELSSTSAISNANGEAIVYFSVTKNAGDNFRVAASTVESDLNGVTISGTGLVDADGVTLARSPKAKQTELLTVWRKVHLEIDSMAEVMGNAVNGNFPLGTRIDVGTTPVWVTLGSSLISLGDNRYRQFQRPDGSWIDGGRLSIGFGSSSLRVLDNTENSVLVKSDGEVVPVRGRQVFSLFDDDDYNSNDPLWRGDDLEDVDSRYNYTMGYCENNETLSQLCPTSDVQRNPYAAAYIEPEYNWARSVPGMNDANVRFELEVVNNPYSYTWSAERDVINPQRDSVGMENNDFWIGYILLGYQSNLNADDPTTFKGIA